MEFHFKFKTSDVAFIFNLVLFGLIVSLRLYTEGMWNYIGTGLQYLTIITLSLNLCLWCFRVDIIKRLDSKPISTTEIRKVRIGIVVLLLSNMMFLSLTNIYTGFCLLLVIITEFLLLEDK